MREKIDNLIKRIHLRSWKSNFHPSDVEEIRKWADDLLEIRDGDYADRLEYLEKRMDAVEMQRCGLRGEEQVLESLEQFIQEWRGD